MTFLVLVTVVWTKTMQTVILRRLKCGLNLSLGNMPNQRHGDGSLHHPSTWLPMLTYPSIFPAITDGLSGLLINEVYFFTWNACHIIFKWTRSMHLLDLSERRANFIYLLRTMMVEVMVEDWDVKNPYQEIMNLTILYISRLSTRQPCPEVVRSGGHPRVWEGVFCIVLIVWTIQMHLKWDCCAYSSIPMMN